MRRFSQRHSLVTLSDINITPLLDLAFVLLIIFIITTPLMQNSLNVNLPPGGSPDDTLKKEDVQFVEIRNSGSLFLNERVIALEMLGKVLGDMKSKNPNMVVRIQADQEGIIRYLTDVLNQCEQYDIRRIQVATDPHSN